MITQLDRDLLSAAVERARRSRAEGNHPFGAVLADARGKEVLAAGNTVPAESDCTGHAETNLARAASRKFDRAFLSGCTLYTSAEPCAMCSGAIYWSGIGRVVYALSESRLRQITGDDPENPTLDLPCRDVFARGQRPIAVDGPIDTPGAAEVHEGFWKAR
ncbi:MAG: nucleoside deaminase [Spirochaetae bacterium HGW-Spirochaetae-7]|jgi:tRNA(Arg) A34 adenosine deaminase TadA|nr:MAG: nucleoside deaminase [Spirochaetae bacterium HGW-Spirochaetae-7]